MQQHKNVINVWKGRYIWLCFVLETNLPCLVFYQHLYSNICLPRQYRGRDWNKIQEQFKADSKNKQDYRKQAKTVLILCCWYQLVNMASSVYFIYNTTVVDCMLAPFKPGDLSPFGERLLRAFVLVPATLTGGAWCFPIGIFFLFSEYLFILLSCNERPFDYYKRNW